MNTVDHATKIKSVTIGKPGLTDHYTVGKNGVKGIYRNLGVIKFVDIYYDTEVHRFYDVMAIVFDVKNEGELT